MGAIQKVKQAVGNFIDTLKKILKKIGKAIKIFTTPIGTVLGWILLILFIILLLATLVKIGEVFLEDLFGNYTYDTFNSDLEVMQQLADAGYARFLNAEKVMEFKNFEYALTMDTAFFLISGEKTLQQELNPDKTSAKDKAANNLLKPGEKIEILSSTGNIYEQENIDVFNRKHDLLRFMNIGDYCKTLKEKIEEKGDEIFDRTKEQKYGSDKVQDIFVVFEFKYALSGDGETLSDTKGELVPYLYVPRDEVEYTYSVGKMSNHDADDVIVMMPKILNVFNSTLPQIDGEWAKEIRESHLNSTLTVTPDEEFTHEPYYATKTKSTMYKIPLEAIIGRYMPKIELLESWCIAKNEVAVEGTLLDTISEDIKLLYTYNTIDTTAGGKIETVYGEKYSGDELVAKSEKGRNYYVQAPKERTTFLRFGQIGLEVSRFSSVETAKDDTKGTYQCIVNFKHAARISDGMLTTIADTINGNPTVINGETPVAITIGTVTKDDVAATLGFKKGKYMFAEEAEAAGRYLVPSTITSEEAYIMQDVKKDDIPTKLEELKNKLIEVYGDVGSSIDLQIEYKPAFILADAKVDKMVRVEDIRMPALLVTSAETWARSIHYNYKFEQNIFNPDDERYIIPENTYFTGLTKFEINQDVNDYRTKAYEKLFKNIQEKDVITMFLQYEEAGENGNTDCYEYMRDLYKLVKAAQKYSDEQQDGIIHDKTYTYMYVPESVLYYDDSQTQKIYWCNLLGVVGGNNYLSSEDVEHMKCKNDELKWQVLEYEKYPECDGKVYALFPIGSAVVRSYSEMTIQDPQDRIMVDGNYKLPNKAVKYSEIFSKPHTGSDFYGREIAEAIYRGAEANGGVFDNINAIDLIRQYGIANYKNNQDDFDYEVMQEFMEMPIVAVAPGKVVYADYDSINGFCVIVQHTEDNSLYTGYYHLKRWPAVSVGDYIGAGTIIGYEGSSGNSRGTHLHFEIASANGSAVYNHIDMAGVLDATAKLVNAKSYLFGSTESNGMFSPFYNEEKAKEVGYSIDSRYMSLYRIVNPEKALDGNITNNVPDIPLLESIDGLIQKQGEVDRTYSTGEDIGWADASDYFKESIKSQSSFEDFKKQNCCDLFLPEEYFNHDLAMEKGYLDMPYELVNLSYSNIDILTNSATGLPAITKEEFVEIIEGWLKEKYEEKEYKYIRENAYNDSVISKIIELQNRYNISAVFILASIQYQSQSGLLARRIDGYDAVVEDGYNLLNIKGNLNGGVKYKGVTYNKYDSYEECISDYVRIINGYVMEGIHVVKDLSESNRDFGYDWYKEVSNNVWYALSNLPGYNDFITAYLWDTNDFCEVLKKVKEYIATPSLHGGYPFYYGGHGNSYYTPFVEDVKLLYKVCNPDNRLPDCMAQTCNILTAPAYNCVCTDLWRWTANRYVYNKGYTALFKKVTHNRYGGKNQKVGMVDVISGRMIVAKGGGGPNSPCMQSIGHFGEFGASGTNWMAAMPGDEIHFKGDGAKGWPTHWEVLGPDGKYNTGSNSGIATPGPSVLLKDLIKNGKVIYDGNNFQERISLIFRFVDPKDWTKYPCVNGDTGKEVKGEELQKYINANISHFDDGEPMADPTPTEDN